MKSIDTRVVEKICEHFDNHRYMDWIEFDVIIRGVYENEREGVKCDMCEGNEPNNEEVVLCPQCREDLK